VGDGTERAGGPVDGVVDEGGFPPDGRDPDAPPSGESAETKGERTRRTLLEIAIEQFGHHGYRGTSVSEICRRAGLTQAASYAYFDNKEHLFRAAVDADAQALVSAARARTESTPVREVVPALLTHLAAGLDEHPLAKRVLGGKDPEAMIELQGLETLTTASRDLADRLAQGQATGEVRSDVDAAAIAQGAQTIILSLLVTITQWAEPDADLPPGGGIEPEVILGVLAVFDAMLAPPSLVAG
jgi:AcrR family transcriptional regulator